MRRFLTIAVLFLFAQSAHAQISKGEVQKQKDSNYLAPGEPIVVKLEATSECFLRYQVDKSKSTAILLKRGQSLELPPAQVRISLSYGSLGFKMNINNREASFPPDARMFLSQIVISRDNIQKYFSDGMNWTDSGQKPIWYYVISDKVIQTSGTEDESREITLLMGSSDFTEEKLRRLLNYLSGKYNSPPNMTIFLFSHPIQLPDDRMFGQRKPNDDPRKYPNGTLSRTNGREAISYKLPSNADDIEIVVKERAYPKEK